MIPSGSFPEVMLISVRWSPCHIVNEFPTEVTLYMSTGEDFCTAAKREVYEETNVQCDFKSILGFRHSHAQQFGRSNLYVICLLQAGEEAAARLTVDAEIQDAKWMDMDEYRESTHHPMSRLIVDLVLDRRRLESVTDLKTLRLDDQSDENDSCNIEFGLKEKVLSSVLSGPTPYKFYHV